MYTRLCLVYTAQLLFKTEDWDMKNHDLLFRQNNTIFSYRSSGVLIQNGKILIQRGVKLQIKLVSLLKVIRLLRWEPPQYPILRTIFPKF